MNQKQTENKLNKVIVILAILLILCLAALAGTLLYNRWAESRVATVTVPDNYITSDGEGSGTTDEAKDGDSDDAENHEAADDQTRVVKEADKTANSVAASKSKNTNKSSSPASTSTTSSSGTGQTSGGKQAVSLKLYNRKPQENAAFQADNMFPGDSVTQYFRIQVSYQNPVTVRYHADVQRGYEKLAEVLNVRVRLLSSDEELYDGPIGDMPESLDFRLNGSSKTTEELYYEVTAYLDTSVGNDYQNLGLAADFRWWVEETGNLTKPPKTGDMFDPTIWIAAAAVSGTICILLVIKRRGRRDER